MSTISNLDDFLSDHPADVAARLALADALEESGDADALLERSRAHAWQHILALPLSSLCFVDIGNHLAFFSTQPPEAVRGTGWDEDSVLRRGWPHPVAGEHVYVLHFYLRGWLYYHTIAGRVSSPESINRSRLPWLQHQDQEQWHEFPAGISLPEFCAQIFDLEGLWQYLFENLSEDVQLA